MIFIHMYVYVYPRGILIEEEYKTFDSHSTSIAFYLVVALDIVDDFKPKRNSKLRPTQSNAVIDAKLYFNVLHPLYTHCAHCIHTVNRRNDSAESACWRSRSLALTASLSLSSHAPSLSRCCSLGNARGRSDRTWVKAASKKVCKNSSNKILKRWKYALIIISCCCCRCLIKEMWCDRIPQVCVNVCVCVSLLVCVQLETFCAVGGWLRCKLQMCIEMCACLCMWHLHVCLCASVCHICASLCPITTLAHKCAPSVLPQAHPN